MNADFMTVVGLLLFAFTALLVFTQIRRRSTSRWIVLDGSNIMYWRDNDPDVITVREVVVHLRHQGFRALVIFDANAGYLVTGRYQHDAEFACLLKMSGKQVMVVPKGQPADGFILALARDLEVQVVSNDRFRDWAESYPEVKTPGRVIRGGYRDAALWLSLKTASDGASLDEEQQRRHTKE